MANPFLNLFGAEIAKLVSGLGVVFTELQGRMKSINTVAGALQATLKTLTLDVSGLSAAATGAIGGVLSAVGTFAGALSPGTMIVFNRALKDLSATIGVAFTPIFEILSGAFRQIAGVILPVMQQLKPVIATITQALVSTLVPVMQLFADILTGLLPVIQFVAEIFATLHEIIRAAVVVLRTLVQSLISFIGSLLGGFNAKDFLGSFRDAVHRAASALLVFVAQLAQFFGANEFVNKLIANLEEKAPGPGGETAAVSQPRIAGLEQIGKDIAQAASIAAAGGAGAKKAGFEDVVAELKELRRDPSKGELLRVLHNIDTFLQQLINKGRVLTHASQEAYEAARANPMAPSASAGVAFGARLAELF